MKLSVIIFNILKFLYIRAMEKKYRTLTELKSIAHSKGGRCLSEQYENNNSKLLWECSNGHQFESTPKNIKRGNWCRRCAGTAILTIEDMQTIAASKNGKCLSIEYKNAQTKLLWECSNGHQFESKPMNVRRGNWCRKCAGTALLNIEDMNKLAISKKGKCLSTEYKNSRTKILWECSNGHQFYSKPENVKQGRWCKKCAGLEKPNIEELKEIAIKRGGKLVSPKYINNKYNYTWSCIDGHTWEAKFTHIRDGSWCPQCKSSYSEAVCREIFEKIFDEKFPQKRLEWLKNPKTGKRLELDGYSERLKLAFEYQGRHHYEINKFMPTEKLLEQRINLDNFKLKVCSEKGITLIQIPYSLNFNEIPVFIRLKLQGRDELIENSNVDIAVDFDEIHKFRSRIKEIADISRKRGGKLLSRTYQPGQKLKFKCKQNHIWYASASKIKSGQWCGKCVGKDRDIKDMKEIAKKFGGQCLSKKYINNTTKLLWKCDQGHIWEDTPYNINIRGRWCRLC